MLEPNNFIIVAVVLTVHNLYHNRTIISSIYRYLSEWLTQYLPKLAGLSARVDVIPLFLDRLINLHLDDNDIEIAPTPSEYKKRDSRNCAAVRVLHKPSGVTAESSGTEQKSTAYANVNCYRNITS
jgi:hypothetical protein